MRITGKNERPPVWACKGKLFVMPDLYMFAGGLWHPYGYIGNRDKIIIWSRYRPAPGCAFVAVLVHSVYRYNKLYR